MRAIIRTGFRDVGSIVIHLVKRAVDRSHRGAIPRTTFMLAGCTLALAFVMPSHESGAAGGEALLPMQELPPLIGHTFSDASGINHAGQIVGVSAPSRTATLFRAVIWDEGIAHDLGLTLETPPGTPMIPVRRCELSVAPSRARLTRMVTSSGSRRTRREPSSIRGGTW